MMKPKYSQNHLMWPATPFFVDKQRQGFPEAIQLKIKRLRQQVPASKWFTREINNLQSHFLFKSSSLVLIFFALFSPFVYTCLEVTHSPRAEPLLQEVQRNEKKGLKSFSDLKPYKKPSTIPFCGAAYNI